SNGPFLTLSVNGHPVGDLVGGLGATAMVEATVDAPAWIDVDKLRVFVNGQVAAERDVKTGHRPLLHETIPIQLPKGDSWIVLQAGGSKPMRDDLIGEHGGGRVVPFAITNPIYLDGDGDGAFKPAFASWSTRTRGRSLRSMQWPMTPMTWRFPVR